VRIQLEATGRYVVFSIDYKGSVWKSWEGRDDVDNDLRCESKNPPCGWEFLINFLHTYYTFLSMLDYKFYSIISNFDEVMSY